jgi:hypothetical protein
MVSEALLTLQVSKINVVCFFLQKLTYPLLTMNEVCHKKVFHFGILILAA